MWVSSSLLCLQKVVEEEKQEHVDKVKELLGWALGLKQSVQGRTAAAGSRELGDIEKSISEQQVKWGQPSDSLFNFCSFSTAELSFFVLFFCVVFFYPKQALNEELAAKKEQISEAIKTSQIFLAKHSHK